MSEKHTTVRNEFYKCRGCGQVVTFSDERETMLVINGATVKVNLDSGKTEKRVYAIFAGCDQGRVYLLHRCDRSRVCVCDFIGFEVQEDGKWDLLIAHPPCTHLAVSGARWFTEGRKPLSLRFEAAAFFMKFAEADILRIAIENPVCVMSTLYRKPDQIINPWQFGHPEQKKTCLWLKNLPRLTETNNVYEDMMSLPVKERTRIWQLGSGHAKERSKTFPGIAKAMSEQWG